jgi:ligand-binding sensor domain-containing protein
MPAIRFTLLVWTFLLLDARLGLAATIPEAKSTQQIGQLLHRSWTFSEGAPGQISQIHQGADGFLWLSAGQTLYRFDGTRFEAFESDDGLPITYVSTIADGSDGGLWVGLVDGQILSIHGRHVTRYTFKDGVPPGTIRQVLVDTEGRVWACSHYWGLFLLDHGRWIKQTASVGYPADNTNAMLVDKEGTLWVADGERIMKLRRKESRFEPTDLHVSGDVFTLLQAADGTIWATIENGGAGPIAYADGRPYKGTLHFSLETAGMLMSSDGTIWITTLGDGLRRIWLKGVTDQVGVRLVDSYSQNEGLSSNYAWPIAQDREGNVWVGTSAGLDEFHLGALSLAAFPRGAHDFALAADSAGGIVAGTSNRPPMRFYGGRATSVSEQGLSIGPVRAAVRDEQGGVLLGSDNGIFRWRANQLIPFAALPPGIEQVQSLADDGAGGLWASLTGKALGVWHWREGIWHSAPQPQRQQQSVSVIRSIIPYPDGHVLLGGGRLLYEMVNGVIVRDVDVSTANIGSLLTMTKGRALVWVGGRLGFGFYDGGKLRRIESEGNRIWGVSAIIELPNGDLWIDAVPGIFHVSSTDVHRALTSGAKLRDFRRFDYMDGLPGRPTLTLPLPAAIRSDDGRLWFATSNGVAWLDPDHIPRNSLPPPVQVTAARIDGHKESIERGITVPADASNLDIDFTALSLSVPERVHFRYKLNGYDANWQEIVNRRTAYYGHLPPGTYRFTVTGSNNDGVWNNQGATLDVVVLPAFYQQWWFRSICVLVVLLGTWWIYLARIRYIARSIRGRLEVQLAERERIARDLHDTRIPDVDVLRSEMEITLDRADQLLGEARERMLDLRSDAAHGLHEAVEHAARDLANDYAMHFVVITEGSPRRIDARIHDELLSICREAMLNAFRHSKGTLLEVEIAFLKRGLRVRLQDDGIGIDNNILQSGRPGHWGLAGMRERAQQIKGRIRILSRPGEGTEIEITVPARLAFSVRRRGTRNAFRTLP